MLSILDTKDSNQPMQTEVAINVDETLFRAAFEHSPVGIALVSLDGYYLKANHRLCEILGYTETELLSRRTCEVTHPDDNPTNQNQVAQLLAGEITESDVEKRYLHRSGRVIWAQRVTALLRDDQGKPRYFITQVQDITRRRQAEEEVANTHFKLITWLGELEARTREIDLLNKWVALLQTCQTIDEACATVSKFVPALFPGDSGMLALNTASRKRVKIVATWGNSDNALSEFHPDDCWALRRLEPHIVLDSQCCLECRHLQWVPPAYLCIPLVAQGEVLGCLHLSTRAGQLSEHKQQLGTTVADSITLSLANLRLRETLRQQSIMDALTGLFNRRYMEEFLEQEIGRASRNDHPLSIMMADIDHF